MFVDALRDASPSTLTFATGTFSPAARKLAFTTSRHVQVKRRLLVKPVPLGLELSDDLLDLIAKCLLRMQASAGMYARCSKAFKGAVARAASLLEVDEHIFYWTGSSPPMKPPLIELLSPGQKMQEWSLLPARTRERRQQLRGERRRFLTRRRCWPRFRAWPVPTRCACLPSLVTNQCATHGPCIKRTTEVGSPP